MDFIDSVNESWDMRYEETGETGDSVFMLIDIDNDIRHRFYSEDLQILIEFLNDIKNILKSNISLDLNESYYLHYGSYCGEYYLTINDLDNNERLNFCTEDIKKITEFLNRLKGFGVMKL